jgi:hypothetical protein
VPEETVEIWRENKSAYLRPPLNNDYNVNEPAAMRRYQSYRNQSVEAHANQAGTEFRKQTRQIVARVPDDIEFKIIFTVAMVAAGWILLKLSADDTPDLNFEECVLAIHDGGLMLENPIKILESLHKALSHELGMKPLPAYLSADGRKKTSYERVVFSADCLHGSNLAVAEVAGETWRACNYEFGGGQSADMLDYIDGIISRADEVLQV